MAISRNLQLIFNDPVRLVQAFTLCRYSGIILASVIVAHVLPLEEVGTLELLMFCGYIMTFFWSDAFLKGYLAKKESAGKVIAPSTFLLFSLLAGFVAMSLLYVARTLMLPLLTHKETLSGLVLYGLYQACIVPVWLAPFTGALKKYHTVLLSAYVLIGPGFAAWVGYQSIPGLEGILIGLLSFAVVGLVWMLTQITFLNDLPIRKFLLMIWPVTWPLILYAISAAIARSLDAWLVARYYDESIFAIFRYGAKEFPLVVALAGGLSTIMIPRLLQPHAIDELKMRSTRLMHLCYPLIALFMLISVPLFGWVFGEAYKSSAGIFNIYLLLTLSQLIFPQTIFTARGDTRLLWYISLIELAVNVIFSLVLMKYLGVIGIVWGTCIAFSVEKIILLLLLKSKYGIRPQQIFSLTIWGGYAVLLIGAFMLSQWIFGI